MCVLETHGGRHNEKSVSHRAKRRQRPLANTHSASEVQRVAGASSPSCFVRVLVVDDGGRGQRDQRGRSKDPGHAMRTPVTPQLHVLARIYPRKLHNPSEKL